MSSKPDQPGFSRLGGYLERRVPSHLQRLLYPGLPGFIKGRLRTSAKGRRGVLFVGSSYYNTWFLSRALRNKGWQADTVSYTDEGADQFLHGSDIRLDHSNWNHRYPFVQTFILVNILRLYAGLKGDDRIDRGVSRIEASILRRLMKWMLTLAGRNELATLRPLVDALDGCDIFHFTGRNNLRYFFFFNPRLFGDRPIEWDIKLLKLLGKKIVYTNIGTNDGISQSSFRGLDADPVCDSCRWRDVPEVCSDESNLDWGRLRNRLADYQIMSYGNRMDFNDDPRVHEVPEFFCLDPDYWHPELLVPTNYRLSLPEDVIKIYHSVGNFEMRSMGNGYRNIKSTHIYLPLIKRLKSEGHRVELIFFHDVPNKHMRYYQAQSDIVVDMLTVGWFGANVREAMMLGKPVVCFLRPEWLENVRQEVPDYADELPVISATPATVHEVLTDLIQNPERRREIGERSRDFAVKWHSDVVGAGRMAEIYSELLGTRPE